MAIPDLLGSQVYEQRCQACHGTTGAGDGPAARYVYPPPRNLRQGNYSLVSSLNRVASRDDVYQAIRAGMPGTSMKAFDDLPDSELQAVVQQVLYFRAEGQREAYLATCEEMDEEPIDDEADEFVRQRTTASEKVQPSEFAVDDPQAVQRGRQLFQEQGCTSCHGPDGVGTEQVALRDAEGNELRARDLVHEPFKGGRSNAAVYRRIRLGFPSGPMPAHSGLTPSQLKDLVAYVQSLASRPKRFLSSHQLRRYATRGLYVRELQSHDTQSGNDSNEEHP